MIVSWNWLAQYVRLDMPESVLSDRLALTGLNHEGTEDVGGDLAIDLEVTSNRPDCLGHLGVAREVSVLFDKPLTVPDPRPATSGKAVEAMTAVKVEDRDLCPQFTARVVSGATIKESPWWMRKRLETIGVRPVSNVVDVTNYVMFECGQPLHAYDLDTLAGSQIVVRRARAGEKLVAINGKTYELTPEMLAIADAEKPVGLAGVMGGLDTEIGAKTRRILIEAARFDPLNVRRTGRALGLASAASYRFERPIDPERTEWASRRCAQLILETAGGTLHPGVIDVGEPVRERGAISLRLDQIPRVLGIAIDSETVARILLALGLKPAGETFTTLAFRPPSWRSDLGREIDLIEEVARVHGYEHIPEDRPVPLARSRKGVRERVEAEVRSALTGMGFDEACTFSLVESADWDPFPSAGALPPLKVEHSTRKREVYLRKAVAPSLLRVRGHNEAHGSADAALFEIAGVYRPLKGQPLPDEPARLAMVSGRNFLELKGVVAAMLARLHVAGTLDAQPSAHAGLTPGRQADLTIGGALLGTLGEVDRSAFDEFGVRSPATIAELDFDRVMALSRRSCPSTDPLPAYPTVERDLSLVVEQSLPWSEVASAARGRGGLDPGIALVPRHLRRWERPRRDAQPAFRDDLPPPRADPHRRGGRARGAGRCGRLLGAVQGRAAGLNVNNAKGAGEIAISPAPTQMIQLAAELDGWPAQGVAAEDQRDHEQDDEDQDADLGDPGQVAREAAEAQDGGDQREDGESDGGAKHEKVLRRNRVCSKLAEPSANPLLNLTAILERGSPSRLGSTGADGDADHQADDQAQPEGGGDRLTGTVADQVLGHLVAVAGELAGLAVAVLESLAGVRGHGLDLLGRLAHGRGPAGGQRAEELLDRLAAFAGALLDLADELVEVAAADVEVVVGELAPLLLDLALELVPLPLQLLRVDRHRRINPRKWCASGVGLRADRRVWAIEQSNRNANRAHACEIRFASAPGAHGNAARGLESVRGPSRRSRWQSRSIRGFPSCRRCSRSSSRR